MLLDLLLVTGNLLVDIPLGLFVRPKDGVLVRRGEASFLAAAPALRTDPAAPPPPIVFACCGCPRDVPEKEFINNGADTWDPGVRSRNTSQLFEINHFPPLDLHVCV